jgi:hypothetical protein
MPDLPVAQIRLTGDAATVTALLVLLTAARIDGVQFALHPARPSRTGDEHLATEPFAFLVTWGTLFACVVTASFVLQTVFFALAVGFWELLPRAFQDRQRRGPRQRATVDGEVV